MNFLTLIYWILNILSSPILILILLLLIILIHIILFYLKDKKYIKILENFKDPESVSIRDLKETPLINIIVPAWKEGQVFFDCLNSITKLSYPNIKVIVNAGGNDETIKIANYFSKFNNFKILRQTGGTGRAETGKIMAINECLQYISEGITYFIDADCYLTDEIILRHIYPIINENEEVIISAGVRPLIKQEKIDLVNYFEFFRFNFPRAKFVRYHPYAIGGASTCVSYNVIKKVGKFTEGTFHATEFTRAKDMISKGFKIYCLIDYRSRIYTYYPETISERLDQRKRYFENNLIFAYKNKKKMPFFKFIMIQIYSFYIILSPLLIIYHLSWFLIAVYFLFFLYLRKIRYLIFFNIVVNKEFRSKIRKRLYLKLIYYIIVELLINIYTLLKLKNYSKSVKNNKEQN